MRNTAQPHASRPRMGNWRLCWRDLVYITLFMCSAQSVFHGQVVSLLCTAGSAPGAPEPYAGAEQLVVGRTVPNQWIWTRQLLCMSMLHSSSSSSSSSGNAAGAASVPVLSWPGIELPLISIMLKALDNVLGFLVRPWLLLALQHDPYSLYHLVSSTLVTAGVIWPALRCQAVSGARRTITHTSVRLLHAAFSLHSASLPGGLYRQYVLSMLAHGGRWKVLASVAWCHGLLLQVPLALQLPLCLLEWAGTALTCSGLGAPQWSWAQHCLDGLLMVGVPVAAAVLMQHTGRSKGTSRLAVELTQTSSSSKVGTFCSGHTHNSQQQQQQAAAAAAPAEACTSISRSWIQFSCTLLLGCATCCRTVSTRGVGTAGAGEGVGNPQGVSSPAVVATGPPSVAATASGPPAPIHGGDDPAATLQPAASQPPTVPSGASARPAAFQQQQQQQVLPALVASCGPEGFRELPPQLWYTAVTRLMPVNFKVPLPAGVGYAVAAGQVTASAQGLLSAMDQQQKLVTQLVTVPGCVLLMMEVVEAAAEPAAARQAETPWAGRPALLQGAWQVALAAVGVGQLRVAVEATCRDGGPQAQQELPLQQLQQHISSFFSNSARASPPPTPSSTSIAVPGSSPPPLAEPIQSGATSRPCTTCIIGTWGEPLQLQLVAAEGPCAGSVALPPAVRVVVTHLQQVVLDEEVALEVSGAGGGTGSSSSSLGGTTSLVLTCDLLAACASAASPADSQICVLTINILPVAPPTVQDSLTPPPAALPLAHITVVLLPPKPAAELAGWVAAAQLPASYVFSWGRDLAVLVGCAQQLKAARASPVALPIMRTAVGGGASCLSKADLLQLCHLAVLAAGALEGLFSGCGLVCGGDLVAVTKQRVLVGATSLAPMAAGRMVPAIGQGQRGVQSLEVEAAAAAAASGVHVTVVAKRPSTAAAASLDAPGIGRAGGLEEGVGVSGESPAGTWNGSSSSSSSSSGSGNGNVCVSPVSETPAGPGGLMGPVAASLTKPSHAPSSSSSSSSSTPIPTKPRTSGNLATAAPPLVTPAEAAADAGAGWGAWLLCWRGFRAPGAEGAFQSYRGAALRRWDWVCRLSVLVLGAGLTVKKMQLLEGPWAGGTTAPGWLIVLENVSHVMVLGLASRWWRGHRDLMLTSHIVIMAVLWVWQALAWPAATFRAVYGSGARPLMLPIQMVMNHKGPWATVLCCALVCPLAFSTLLLQARACEGPGGLDGALYPSIQGRSWLLVLAGMVFSAANLLVALVCSLVVELRVRRAWVREQAAQLAVRPMEGPHGAGKTLAGAHASQAQPPHA